MAPHHIHGIVLFRAFLTNKQKHVPLEEGWYHHNSSSRDVASYTQRLGFSVTGYHSPSTTSPLTTELPPGLHIPIESIISTPRSRLQFIHDLLIEGAAKRTKK